jgi:parallel beta-helix repeat protein
MASSVDTLVVIKGQNYLVFQGLSFQGSNLDAFNATGGTGITITGCNFAFSGLNAIKAMKVADMDVDNVSVRYSNSNSIDITGTHNTIHDNKVSYSGTVAGMGAPEASYVGIYVSGTGNTVQYNEVDTTGYVGIFFLGNANTIKNNVVQRFALVKDDGGGIYTWSGNTDTIVEQQPSYIVGNIVLDGVTAPAGTDKKQAGIAYGIYLDENSSRMEITGNTVSRCVGGIFLQDAHEVTVKNNTLYDNGFQISLRHPLVKGTLRNNKIINNIAAAKTDDQNVLVLSSAVSGDVTPYADFDGNKYMQPSSKGTFFKVVTRPAGGNATQAKGNLDQWRSGFGKDQNSSPVMASPGQTIFECNKTRIPRTITLNGSYTDLSGQTYQGKVDLPPYSSILLYKK